MPQKYSKQGLFYMRINKLEKIHTCWGERWIRAEAKLLSSEFMMSDYVLDCTEYSSMHLYSEKYCEKQNENVKQKICQIDESVIRYSVINDAENKQKQN